MTTISKRPSIQPGYPARTPLAHPVAAMQVTARRDSSNDAFYFFADQLGTSRIVAEVRSGQTTAALCYDADFYPFGDERAYTTTCSPIYKFTEHERDSECNLDNLGARFASSMIDTFQSPDPENDGADPSPPAEVEYVCLVA